MFGQRIASLPSDAARYLSLQSGKRAADCRALAGADDLGFNIIRLIGQAGVL